MLCRFKWEVKAGESVIILYAKFNELYCMAQANWWQVYTEDWNKYTSLYPNGMKGTGLVPSLCMCVLTILQMPFNTEMLSNHISLNALHSSVLVKNFNAYTDGGTPYSPMQSSNMVIFQRRREVCTGVTLVYNTIHTMKHCGGSLYFIVLH